MKRKPALTLLEAVLILAVVVVWLYLYTGAVVRETRLERVFVLDANGTPTEVWEQGKGHRAPTQEEEEYDLDRREGEQE